MITVNAWYPKHENVGHASAQIGSFVDGYVSWWPTGNWMKTSPGSAPSFQHDSIQEGGPPHEFRKIHGLNEFTALRWWQTLRKQNSEYWAFEQNCSWAVITMLKAAGADEKLGWWVPSKYRIPLGVLAPHLCALTLIPAMLDNIVSGKVETAMRWSDNCLPVWTPKDVIKYVDSMEQF